MPQRDDDPVHPNFDGVQFQAVTDKRGIVVRPTCGNTQLVASFMSVTEAHNLANGLAAMITDMRRGDPMNYLATFFETVLDDLNSAVSDCEAA